MSDSSHFAFQLKNVTVKFRAYTEQPTTLQEAMVKYIKTGKRQYYSEFYALSNINLTVKKGSIVGVIGSNGAGKSTLLRVLSSVLLPTEGTVLVNGTVDSLISLGAGFDEELTVKENIFLYAALRGRSSAKIAAKVEKILDFAELHQFAATPLKYLSSGMAARLGFSCAIDINPDILLVDEVLAVGDARFEKKSEQVMHDFANSGKTVIIVSHNLDHLVLHAEQIAVLEKGRLAFFGDPREAIKRYRDPSYECRLETSSKTLL